MQNLEQLRAAHALRAATLTDKSSVAKLPGMILTNGLLATLAFACEEGKIPRANMRIAADSLAQHLRAVLPEAGAATSGCALARNLSLGEALTLQRATLESLAYFAYLKRYALKSDPASNPN